MRKIYGIFARNTGNWEYEMVWGDVRRVYLDADEARQATSRLTELVDEDEDAPDGLEYFVAAIQPDDEVDYDPRTGATTAQEHLDAVSQYAAD